MPMFDVEVSFSGTVHFEIEAADRDDASCDAINIFEECDKGRLVMGEFLVTGTFAEQMTKQDIKELKHADQI